MNALEETHCLLKIRHLGGGGVPRGSLEVLHLPIVRRVYDLAMRRSGVDGMGRHLGVGAAVGVGHGGGVAKAGPAVILKMTFYVAVAADDVLGVGVVAVGVGAVPVVGVVVVGGARGCTVATVVGLVVVGSIARLLIVRLSIVAKRFEFFL